MSQLMERFQLHVASCPKFLMIAPSRQSEVFFESVGTIWMLTGEFTLKLVHTSLNSVQKGSKC